MLKHILQVHIYILILFCLVKDYSNLGLINKFNAVDDGMSYNSEISFNKLCLAVFWLYFFF